MRNLLVVFIIAMTVFAGARLAFAQQISLDGLHAVTVAEDNPIFALPEYDDSQWSRIETPGSLRAAGLDARPDVFWYRIAFDLPDNWSSTAPAFRLGTITRSDEVFLNGVRIGGTGQVGARLSDWHAYAPLSPRLYPFDPTLLRPGETNLLSVRGAREPYIDDGGIIDGPLALVTLPDAIDSYLRTERQVMTLRYLLFGIENMMLLGALMALALGVRSRFLGLFLVFYVPAYLFSLEARGILAAFGLDTPALQFTANIIGALALPGLMAFTAYVLNWRIGWLGRTVQVLSVLLLIVIPNSGVPILETWVIESHLAWHSVMLLGLLLMTFWTVSSAIAGVRNALPISAGLACMFLALAIDIGSLFNGLERAYGVRVGELGIILLYLSMAFVVIRSLVDTERGLRTDNARISHLHEVERARMARDVHDGIGQWLMTIRVKLDLLSREAPELNGLERDVNSAIEDVRRVALDLAPMLLEERGLIGAIRAHSDRVKSTGQTNVRVNAPEDITLSAAQTTHVFRIFQEALVNALKHSKCSDVFVSVSQEASKFHLRVIDNGIGFDAAAPIPEFSQGLKAMRSRARLLRADLEIRSSAGEGVSVHLSFPSYVNTHGMHRQ